jgi:hypothetical protein
MYRSEYVVNTSDYTHTHTHTHTHTNPHFLCRFSFLKNFITSYSKWKLSSVMFDFFLHEIDILTLV